MKNIDSINKNPDYYRPPQIHTHVGSAPPSRVSLMDAGKTGKSKKSRRWFKRILLVFVLLLLIGAGYVAVRAVNLTNKIFVGQKTTFIEKIQELIRGGSGNTTVAGEEQGQINILLLGIGGEGHDGPYLTDTMILAQIRPDLKEVTLTSIPRDYWVQIPNSSDYAKINSAFTDGYLQNHDWNEGGDYARQAVENLSGLSIPYFAIIDFSGFEKAVDQVGGLDVTIDRTFTDYSYPDNGTGYLPPITFTQGQEHMDGVRALEFARSRHAAGIEGSDFARSLRQQKIIDAFKAKVLNLNLVSNVSTINNLLNIVADHFHTNLSPDGIFHLYNLIKQNNMQNLSLSLDPDTGLICPEIAAADGAYILTPCPGKSEQDVENFFKNSFSIGKLASEKSIVWLASSTGDRAAYNTAFRKLTDAGLTVFELNYSKDNLAQTIVYEANPKPATTEFITNELHATEVNLPPPGVTVSKDKVDVIVVLGTDAPVEAAPTPYVAPPARQDATTTQAEATTTPTSTLPTVLP